MSHGIPRPLTMSEDIEQLQRRLSCELDRPVFLCGGHQGYGATHLRLPDEPETEYRYISRLWRFLSKYEMGNCVKRIDTEQVNDPEGDPNYPTRTSSFYFDLHLSPTLCLVFPLLPGESHANFNLAQVIPKDIVEVWGSETRWSCTAEDTEVAENGLVPFLHEFQLDTHRDRRATKGLRFLKTGSIQAPFNVRPEWSVAGTSHADNPKRAFKVVCPPGKYSFDTSLVADFNHYTICDRDPGGCIVCRGESGSRRHFGGIGLGPGAYATALICHKCFPGFTAAITDLLMKEL